MASQVDVVEMNNTLRVIILQHPQEPDKVLGSAPIVLRSLAKADLRIGLSWRSLKSVAGEDALPSDWAVIYLGSKKASIPTQSPITFFSKKGAPLAEYPKIKGVILLDGTWSQVKTLWWRNAWLTKLSRIGIQPEKLSLYGKLRKEPRKEAISSVEAIAYVLRELDPRGSEIFENLIGSFSSMLEMYREKIRDQEKSL